MWYFRTFQTGLDPNWQVFKWRYCRPWMWVQTEGWEQKLNKGHHHQHYEQLQTVYTSNRFKQDTILLQINRSPAWWVGIRNTAWSFTKSRGRKQIHGTMNEGPTGSHRCNGHWPDVHWPGGHRPGPMGYQGREGRRRHRPSCRRRSRSTAFFPLLLVPVLPRIPVFFLSPLVLWCLGLLLVTLVLLFFLWLFFRFLWPVLLLLAVPCWISASFSCCCGSFSLSFFPFTVLLRHKSAWNGSTTQIPTNLRQSDVVVSVGSWKWISFCKWCWWTVWTRSCLRALINIRSMSPLASTATKQLLHAATEVWHFLNKVSYSFSDQLLIWNGHTWYETNSSTSHT